MKHFRVFGCISHAHIPDTRRTKLDNKSFVCILLGVSEESKVYRLYNPISKRIAISRDVIFEEKKQWNWDKSFEKQILVDLEWGNDENCTDFAEDDVDNNERGSNADMRMVNDEPNSIILSTSIEANEEGGRIR